MDQLFMTAKLDERSFSDQCKQYLNDRWHPIVVDRAEEECQDPLSGKHSRLKERIEKCLRSKTKTYRYVLPTQILCKCVNSKVDCRSLQALFKSEGAFDARTIAHGVIVPFDQENHQVLGGSAEPYVNNPLRCDSVTKKNRGRQKNKEDWDKLVAILEEVECSDDPTLPRRVFDQILCFIYDMLDDVTVTYPVPNKVSLQNTLGIMKKFLSTKSGGDRLEALVTALFRVIGKNFGLFDEVRRQKVNAADVSSGMVADIECWRKGKIVLIVEVKDRTLSLVQMDSKLSFARSKKISEIMFVAQEGIAHADLEQINDRMASEFVSGQNTYVVELLSFATSLLMVLGESGRVDFLHDVGVELDRVGSPIPHRKDWAALLQAT
ncbi:MAG TPA: hypothetical protein DEP53_04635 [Bacteroidetes bacterium]|nr:hypothetical protein [Bacteroidota bacterium]